MLLPRLTTCQKFEIIQPRWHDRTVLLARHKVGTHNSVVFTNAPTYPGEYYVSGRDVTRSELTTNGTIQCFAVPLDYLEPLEREGIHTPPPIPRSQKQLRLIN
jgi:hypothetical protein